MHRGEYLVSACLAASDDCRYSSVLNRRRNARDAMARRASAAIKPASPIGDAAKHDVMLSPLNDKRAAVRAD